MENMHLEPITKEILEMLAKYTFTPERNFRDACQIYIYSRKKFRNL